MLDYTVALLFVKRDLSSILNHSFGLHGPDSRFSYGIVCCTGLRDNLFNRPTSTAAVGLAISHTS